MAFDMEGDADNDGEAATKALGEGAGFNGLRVLLVEDEFLVALEVEDALRDLGCNVLGPFAKLSKATDATRGAELDGAILDINLNGEMVYPLAEFLASKNVPFVFLTGYTAADIPEKYRACRRLQKPLDVKTLQGALLNFRGGAH